MEQVSPFDHLEDYEPPCCGICGAELEWVSCWKCGGQSEFDLYEEDPLAYAPGQTETCDECDGEGGWIGCEMSHDSASGDGQ